MGCKYEEVLLESLITDIAAGPFGSNLKVSCFVPEGFPIIDGANLKGFKVTDNITKFVTEEKARSLSRSIAKRNDVVVTISGTLGQIAYIPETSCYPEYLCSQRQFRVTLDSQKVHVPYLVYYFHTYEGQNKILSFANQTGVPSLTQPLKNFKRIKINLPDIEAQKKIANIVGQLTDKIELNNKINENLIAQMQLLYQNLLTNCDCSLIRLEDISRKIAMGPFGSNIKVSTFVSEGVPIISGNHLRSVFLEEQSYNFITEEHAQKLKNSIVYPRDIIFTHAGNIGQVAMIPDGCNYPYYMISQRQFYMRCDETKVIPELVLFFFHSREGKGKLLANANSTGVPSIAQPATHLKNIEMPLPNKKAQDTWHKVIRPMVDEYVALCQENKRIAALRDSLLPKLMNGEIDIDGI